MSLTNCDSCAHYVGRNIGCQTILTGSREDFDRVGSWAGPNRSDDCAPLPGATGCPGHTAKSEPSAAHGPTNLEREIEAWLAAATPGPWADMGDSEGFEGQIRGCDYFVHICSDPEGDDRPADRALIANAPTALRYLLDLVAELRRTQ